MNGINCIIPIKTLCRRIREDILTTTFSVGSKGSHVGGCLSIVEILAVLYHDFVRYDTNDLTHRDRMVLSKGHAALALYCTLYEIGLLSKESLQQFEANGSSIAAHSPRDLSQGLEFCGGSLGLGLSYAVGIAYACLLRGDDCRVYCIVGDGELDEGIVWESLLFAAHKCLHNFTLIVDYNHLQADGSTENVLNLNVLSDKLRSFGFSVSEVDGHNTDALKSAIQQSSIETESPNAVIAQTCKGMGVSFMENKVKWHHGSLNESKYKKAMQEQEESSK